MSQSTIFHSSWIMTRIFFPLEFFSPLEYFYWSFFHWNFELRHYKTNKQGCASDKDKTHAEHSLSNISLCTHPYRKNSGFQNPLEFQWIKWHIFPLELPLDSSGMHFFTLESSGNSTGMLVEFPLDSSGMHYFPLESSEIPLESSGIYIGITPVGKSAI